MQYKKGRKLPALKTSKWFVDFKLSDIVARRNVLSVISMAFIFTVHVLIRSWREEDIPK